jgi:hypothetical protein
MKLSDTLSRPIGIILVILVASIALLVGWHQEITSRYPISDLPMVDLINVENQVRGNNLSRKEAVYYRKTHAGADTTEIR